MESPDLRTESRIIPVSCSEWKTESFILSKATPATAAGSGNIQWDTMRSSGMDVRRIDDRLSDKLSEWLSDVPDVSFIVKMPIIGLAAVGSGHTFLLEMMN